MDMFPARSTIATPLSVVAENSHAGSKFKILRLKSFCRCDEIFNWGIKPGLEAEEVAMGTVISEVAANKIVITLTRNGISFIDFSLIVLSSSSGARDYNNFLRS